MNGLRFSLVGWNPPFLYYSSAWALTVNTSLSGAVPGHANRFPIATQLFKTLPDENFLELRVVLDRSTYCTLSPLANLLVS